MPLNDLVVDCSTGEATEVPVPPEVAAERAAEAQAAQAAQAALPDGPALIAAARADVQAATTIGQLKARTLALDTLRAQYPTVT